MNTLIKILIVVTSHGFLGDTGKQTGYYLSEVAHPYQEFINAGMSVDIASPKGGKAPMDENSRNMEDPIIATLMQDQNFTDKLAHTLKLEDIEANEYQAIVFAGGHGTMWDFPNNPEINRLTAGIFEHGGVVGAICHGPAALLNVRLSDNSFLLQGRKVTGFSNLEEDAVALTQIVPFALETEMKKRGAQYSVQPLWQEHIVVDGHLVTGQNPASALGVGKAVVELLKK